MADTSLCSLVDNEGICLDRLQVVRAVEQLQLALIGGRAELADGSERALVGCGGDNNGGGRIGGSSAYLGVVERDGMTVDGYRRLVYIVDEADVVDVEAVSRRALTGIGVGGEGHEQGFGFHIVVVVFKGNDDVLPSKAVGGNLSILCCSYHIGVVFVLWILIVSAIGESRTDGSVRMVGNRCLLFELHPNGERVGRAVHECIERITMAVRGSAVGGKKSAVFRISSIHVSCLHAACGDSAVSDGDSQDRSGCEQ